MVSYLHFISDDPSYQNPAASAVYSVKLLEKNKNKLKRGRGWPISKNIRVTQVVKLQLVQGSFRGIFKTSKLIMLY